MRSLFTVAIVPALLASLFAAVLVAPTAQGHEGTGIHEPISGRIEPRGAWSWTVDEPEGLSYYLDNSQGRQGALRIMADDDSKQATHTIRIVGGNSGEAPTLQPQDLTVKMGDKVTWVNDDTVAHTLVGSSGFYREPEAQPGKGVPGMSWGIGIMILGVLAGARRRE